MDKHQKKIDDILSRFPGPVTLYPSRATWLGVMFICAGFVAIDIWMIIEGNTWGWGGLAFFGFGIAVSTIAILPAAGGLKLDRDGFEITSLYRSHALRWLDTSGFEVAIVPPSRQHMVVFDNAHVAKKALAKLNASLVGRNSSLPDTYGLRAIDLAGLMNKWRMRAGET